HAAVTTKSGEVLGKTAARHTSARFFAFLADIVVNQPADKEIHVWLIPVEAILLRSPCPSTLGCCSQSLGGEAFGGERLVRRRCPDIRRRRSAFFLDLGEQPGLNRGGYPLSLRIITGETAGLTDYGTQLGDAAATSVVE